MRVITGQYLGWSPIWSSHMHGLCPAVLALFYLELDRLVLPKTPEAFCIYTALRHAAALANVHVWMQYSFIFKGVPQSRSPIHTTPLAKAPAKC